MNCRHPERSEGSAYAKERSFVLRTQDDKTKGN